MIQHLWETQQKFQKHFFDADNLSHDEKIKWSKEFILSAMLELSEVMDTLKWKTYHDYKKIYTIEDTKEELVDVMKFIINICIVNGISADEFMTAFNKKSQTVNERYKEYQEIQKKNG